MPRTRIIDRGYEAVINVLPEIGGEEIDRIFQKVNTDLFVGNPVSLADVQEMFGVKRTRYSDRYFLRGDYDLDWLYIFDERISKAYSQVVGVSIIVTGFYKERKKQECTYDQEKTWEDRRYLQLPLETDGNGTCMQLAMRL